MIVMMMTKMFRRTFHNTKGRRLAAEREVDFKGGADEL